MSLPSCRTLAKAYCNFSCAGIHSSPDRRSLPFTITIVLESEKITQRGACNGTSRKFSWRYAAPNQEA